MLALGVSEIQQAAWRWLIFSAISQSYHHPFTGGSALTLLARERCIACRRDSPSVSDSEIAELHSQALDWNLIDPDDIPKLDRVFRFRNFAEALEFTNLVGELIQALAESNSSAGRRFDLSEGSNEYFVIDADGNLQIWDSIGLLYTAKKIE